MRIQSAVEFLTTYGWSFIIIAIFVSVILIFVSSKGISTYAPSSCYISPAFLCQDFLLMENASGLKGVVVFSNYINTNMSFTTNSFSVFPYYNTTAFTGTCAPQSARPYSLIVCNTTLKGLYRSVGSQSNINFEIYYNLCASGKCTLYNVSGTATVTVSPQRPVFERVTLETSPSNAGKVLVDGIPYANGSSITTLYTVTYSLFAQPNGAYAFGSWSASGNVLLASSSSQSTTFSSTGNGTIIATFAPT
ncbi:MAG: hypothetical protein QXT43_00170 [Candidatus Micrarchaeaceae archaeon]